jgi:iron uptake system component EfeO
MTFVAVNGGTKLVDELEVRKPNGVILGEHEEIVGDATGSFTLSLGPGRYVLACPLPMGGGHGTLGVTGAPIPAQATAATELDAATEGYKDYVQDEVALLRQGTRRFSAAVSAGKLEQAKALYGPVRRHYEAIESVAESFGDLDPRLDARVNDVAAGTPWTGFHRIEQILWVKGTTEGAAGLARQLDADVATLQRKVATLTYQPAQLGSACTGRARRTASSAAACR